MSLNQLLHRRIPITWPKKNRVEAAWGALDDPRPSMEADQLAVEENPETSSESLEEAFFEEIETNLCIQDLGSEGGLS